MTIDTATRGRKAADSRMFKSRWTDACDSVKRRGLVAHATKPGPVRDAEKAALSSLMADLRTLYEQL